MGGEGGDGSGDNASDGSSGNASDGEQWGAADEASLAHPWLTSRCAARFLTGHRPVPVHSPGAGDPCSRPSFKYIPNSVRLTQDNLPLINPKSNDEGP